MPIARPAAFWRAAACAISATTPPFLPVLVRILPAPYAYAQLQTLRRIRVRRTRLAGKHASSHNGS